MMASTNVPKPSFDDLFSGLLDQQAERLTAQLLEVLKSAPGNSPPDEPLSIDEAATFLKIKKQTLYSYVSEGKIPHCKPGKALLFLRSDLLRWLKDHRIDAKDSARVADAEFIRINRKKRA